MGNEKPEALQPSKTTETILPGEVDDNDDDAPSQTPLQLDAYKPAPVTPAAEVKGEPVKDAATTVGAVPETAPAVAPEEVAAAAAPAGAPQDLVAQAGDPPPDAPAEKQVVTDKAEATDAKADEPIDPYEHIDNAQLLKTELETLAAQDRKPDEIIEVRINGEDKKMTVAERVAQLKTGMVAEMDLARKGADSLRMVGDATNPGIDDIAKMNKADRDKLAKELGLDIALVTIDSLGKEFQKAAGNQERQGKINELAEAMLTRDALTRLHFAPMTVRMVEAEFRGRGYLDPSMKLNDTISDEQLKKAFDTFNSATQPGAPADIAAFGDGKEVREAKEVYSTSARTLDILKLDQQQKRGLSVVEEMNLATKPGEDPETHYKKAIQLADTLNVGYLANAAYKPENKQDNISQEIVDTIRMGSHARLKYADFLAGQKRFQEAQGLMAQVKSDSPELIYAMENDQPVYRKYDNGKKSYEELDRKVTLGITVNPSTFEIANNKLFDKLNKGKIGTPEDSAKFVERLQKGELATDAEKVAFLQSDEAKSTEALKVMKLYRDQAKLDVADANKILDKEVETVEASKKKFEGRDQLTKDEEVEKARMERVIASLKATKAERENYVNRIDALTDFTEGVVHLSQGGAKSAHPLFESALAKDPSLDAEFAKAKLTNPDAKTLTELSKMTDDSWNGYWERNYKKFAIAGAAAVGTLSGVGLIGLCGYVGAGVTTTAVVATTGGALAGGATSWGIHRTVNEKAGWPEFRDGAKVGGLSAALVASPWAAQAYRSQAVTGFGRNAIAADAVATSTVSNMASKIGITRGTLVGSLGMSYTFAAGDVYFGKKPIGKAIIDGTKEGTFNTLLLGISRGWGLPVEGQTAIAKATMINKTSVGLGFGLPAASNAMAMAFDGKSFQDAATETLRDGTQNTLMFGLMGKMKVTEPGKMTGLNRIGLNKWTAAGGLTMGGLAPAKNYFDGKITGDQALKDWATNSLIDTASLMFLKKYGLSDHGTGSRIAAPTMGDTMGYAKRAFLMQESWNIAVSVGTKQLAHDLGGKGYYIKDHGSGFVAPLIADFFDRHYPGLDPKHPGDAKEIQRKIDGDLQTPLTSTLHVDKKNVDPLQNGQKNGLFFDYSKKPPKPQK